MRFLLGPGFVSGDSDKALSLVGRADLAFANLGRIALISTLTTSVVPDWNSDRFVYVAIGLGLRVR